MVYDIMHTQKCSLTDIFRFRVPLCVLELDKLDNLILTELGTHYKYLYSVVLRKQSSLWLEPPVVRKVHTPTQIKSQDSKSKIMDQDQHSVIVNGSSISRTL